MNRPTRRKIAFIGGGGVRTPLIVFGVNEAAEHLGAEELVLFDPDRDRVRIMAELGRASSPTRVAIYVCARPHHLRMPWRALHL